MLAWNYVSWFLLIVEECQDLQAYRVRTIYWFFVWTSSWIDENEVVPVIDDRQMPRPATRASSFVDELLNDEVLLPHIQVQVPVPCHG